MENINLDSMSIEELARLRDQASDKLAEKVATRQKELAAEMQKLTAYNPKPKTVAPKKNGVRESSRESLKEHIARAA